VHGLFQVNTLWMFSPKWTTLVIVQPNMINTQTKYAMWCVVPAEPDSWTSDAPAYVSLSSLTIDPDPDRERGGPAVVDIIPPVSMSADVTKGSSMF